jgi:azurin
MMSILSAALAPTLLCSGEAEARSCAVTVEVRDALDFSLTEITVVITRSSAASRRPSC